MQQVKVWLQKADAAYQRFRFKRKGRSVTLDILMFLFLGFFAFFSVWPLLLIIFNAFKPMSEIFLFPPRLMVENPTLNNFRDLSILISNSWVPVSRYIFNTVFITVVGTVGTVLIASMAAFPLAKYRFPGSRVMSEMITYALMFNGTVLTVPVYLIMSYLNLVDSYWAILLPAFTHTLGLFLMRNFMTQIPDSLLEAAKIDGARELRIFGSIVMPVCKPAWITLIILSFQTLWGETGGQLIYTETLKPFSYAISQIVNSGVSRTGAASASSLIMLIVPVTVFIISQNNVLETMATSGIKE
ncbi:MAG: carbohydrate ABC transporter permease [Clostridia bacterium]|nr:carbohydrate ABC transporter permease [Clostridia bacterium]